MFQPVSNKSDFPAMERDMLSFWEANGTFKKSLARNREKGDYVFYDGPPFATGLPHYGHLLAGTIKDIVPRYQTMRGRHVERRFGWDCHGLPIEHQVDKELGAKKGAMSQVEKRRACRTYAEKYVDIQREQFKRFGVFGEWENPYLTMAYPYEAVTVEEFGKLYLNGSVYKGKKPVYWCATCRTALAEAEVEYADHHTPSIYVKFNFVSDIAQVLPKLAAQKVAMVIWTTTPWTIPANLAIAVKDDFIYVAVKINDDVMIVAKDMLDYCLDAFGYQGKSYEIIDEFKGAVLEGQKCVHPLIKRNSLLILAPFVTLDAGTGAVHIAPGHGQEDYEIGLEYGLDNYAPVDDAGKFTEDVEHFAGQFVFDANDSVIKKLDEVGALLGHVPMQHSYPHCWRCKKPIIFRSTEQWFISMEKNDLRKKALECINEVTWIPSWGKDRIYGMVENRPDWCISRQRLWGVPITVFYCAKCKNEVMTREMMDHLVALVEKNGADVWFEKDPKDLMPKHTTCPHCKGTEFTKEVNILDVWFDSGVSHAAVLEKRPDLSSPCDMYLEGNDQHRGWFHSSLLESVGTRGRAPYKNVLTHGFVVDGEGKKMSKSVGNVIGAEEAINKYGAEILRLWVAAEDYTDDIRISEEILKRLMEAYRRIRNTSRFILGNLYDFNMDKDAVAYEQMSELDRWALHRLQEVIKRVTEAYERYQFHVVFYTLYNYCTVDLSALYLDVLKDRLYTNKAASAVRRSGQTAMFIILNAMTRLLAPILTFTSEEVWAAMPDWTNKEDSVHLAQFPEVSGTFFNADLGERWKAMIDAKSEIAKAVEQARKEKIVGHSLDARITIAAPEKLRALFAAHLEDLKALLIVSQLQLADEQDIAAPFRSAEIEGLMVGVEKARGAKCERCWIYDESVGADAQHPTICARCLPNL